MSFPHLFIQSLVEVHKSSSSAHALFFLVFIHRILLHLGLEEFPMFETVHIIAPIGATFHRQRVAQMRASSKHPRVESSSSVAPPPPPSFGDPTANACIDPTAAADPPPFTSNDSSIHRILDTVMTIQAAHGQLLVDVIMELQVLRAKLASFRQSSRPPPFDDGSSLPFGNSSQKGRVHMTRDRGRFFFLEFWSFRLYLGASLCTYFLAHDVFVLISLFFRSCI